MQRTQSVGHPRRCFITEWHYLLVSILRACVLRREGEGKKERMIHPPQEENGKAGLHARQSGGEKAGLASERLAVEQFRVLREGRGGIDPDRCGEFVSMRRRRVERRENQRENPRPRNPRTGHPRGEFVSMRRRRVERSENQRENPRPRNPRTGAPARCTGEIQPIQQLRFCTAMVRDQEVGGSFRHCDRCFRAGGRIVASRLCDGS